MHARCTHTKRYQDQWVLIYYGGGSRIPLGGAPTLYGRRQHRILSNFPKNKLHEIEKILGHRGRPP